MKLFQGITRLEPRFHKTYAGNRFNRQQLASGLQAVTKKENTRTRLHFTHLACAIRVQNDRPNNSP